MSCHETEIFNQLNEQAGIWAAKAWWQHLCRRIDIRKILNIIM